MAWIWPNPDSTGCTPPPTTYTFATVPGGITVLVQILVIDQDNSGNMTFSYDSQSAPTVGNGTTNVTLTPQSISGLANSLASLRQTTDGQISSAVGQANTLIQQIYQLNPEIQSAMISGDTSTGLLDQRGQLVQQRIPPHILTDLRDRFNKNAA